MEIISAVSRKEGSHIVSLEVRGVSAEDFAELVNGGAHLEVIMRTEDGKDKLCVAVRHEPPMLHFDVSKV